MPLHVRETIPVCEGTLHVKADVVLHGDGCGCLVGVVKEDASLCLMCFRTKISLELWSNDFFPGPFVPGGGPTLPTTLKLRNAAPPHLQLGLPRALEGGT